MKIEVTFDKTTKREFRDQCIKRLQSFVSQIKGNKENPQPKRDSVVSTSEEGLGESYRCKLNPVLIDQKERTCLRTDGRFAKTIKKQSQIVQPKGKIIMKNITYTPSQSRVQKRIEEQKIISQRESSSSVFNLAEMNEKVNKILLKFEKTEAVQAENQQTMKEQLELTNRKLDYLIEYIEKGNLLSTRPQSQRQSCRSLQATTFDEKFDFLAKKYHQIKQNSVRSSHRASAFQKSMGSLSATQDSVTFRRI